MFQEAIGVRGHPSGGEPQLTPVADGTDERARPRQREQPGGPGAQTGQVMIPEEEDRVQLRGQESPRREQERADDPREGPRGHEQRCGESVRADEQRHEEQERAENDPLPPSPRPLPQSVEEASRGGGVHRDQGGEGVGVERAASACFRERFFLGVPLLPMQRVQLLQIRGDFQHDPRPGGVGHVEPAVQVAQRLGEAAHDSPPSTASRKRPKKTFQALRCSSR